jgi:hypothetical protein
MADRWFGTMAAFVKLWWVEGPIGLGRRGDQYFGGWATGAIAEGPKNVLLVDKGLRPKYLRCRNHKSSSKQLSTRSILSNKMSSIN